MHLAVDVLRIEREDAVLPALVPLMRAHAALRASRGVLAPSARGAIVYGVPRPMDGIRRVMPAVWRRKAIREVAECGPAPRDGRIYLCLIALEVEIVGGDV